MRQPEQILKQHLHEREIKLVEFIITKESMKSVFLIESPVSVKFGCDVTNFLSFGEHRVFSEKRPPSVILLARAAIQKPSISNLIGNHRMFWSSQTIFGISVSVKHTQKKNRN